MTSLILRIIKQMKNDRRSLALMFLAPILIITLVHVLLMESEVNLTLLIVDLPNPLAQKLEEHAEVITAGAEHEDYQSLLRTKEVDAVIRFTSKGINALLYQPDRAKQTEVLQVLQKTSPNPSTVMVSYVRGNPEWTLFDSMSGIFLSILSFFFVFLIAGIAFVRERTTGTLERMLQTPISRHAVIGGYTLGYGLFATLQSQLIVLFVKYGLNTTFAGTYLTVGVTMTLIAIIAVSTGAFVSIYAHNEFQIVQFIPIVIIPQIFLSGLIPIDQLPGPFGKLAYLTPIYHGSVALEKAMLYGDSLLQITPQVLALLAILLGLFALNTWALRSIKNI